MAGSGNAKDETSEDGVLRMGRCDGYDIREDARRKDAPRSLRAGRIAMHRVLAWLTP